MAASTAALLAACATAPPDTGSLALTASGRLAVRVDATPERPAQSLTAAFEWRGSGERGELTLLSPLGSRIAQARWTPQGAWLVTPDAQAQFDSLEALAERAFGERIPLVAWPDWLAGRPWPGAASAPLAAAASGGTAAGFEQLGWRVDLARFADGRIEALRSAPPTVAVRIVLDKGDEAPARPAVGAAAGAASAAGASKP
ncbi:MAG: lipoprotein insertase outer membrane protein LolB [Rubrivivax sp.]